MGNLMKKILLLIRSPKQSRREKVITAVENKRKKARLELEEAIRDLSAARQRHNNGTA